MDQNSVPVRRFILHLDNYEKHQEVLEMGPYIRKMDLALSVYELLVDHGGDMISMKVTWEMLETMDISPEHLFELAMACSKELLPVEIKRLDQMLIGLGGLVPETPDEEEMTNEVMDFCLSTMVEEEMPIYALTNKRFVRGATILFYTNIAKEMAELFDRDLILLPSSVHEWLLMPDDEGLDLADMAGMVREINATVVEEKDFLSDHIYRYVREKDDFEIVKNV